MLPYYNHWKQFKLSNSKSNIKKKTTHFPNIASLPVKIGQLSKSKDFPLHLLCFCYFHNTLAIVHEKEHRSIEPEEREKRAIKLAHMPNF